MIHAPGKLNYLGENHMAVLKDWYHFKFSKIIVSKKFEADLTFMCHIFHWGLERKADKNSKEISILEIENSTKVYLFTEQIYIEHLLFVECTIIKIIR